MEIEIRDNRQKEWFWLDNEYLNGYAKHLGVVCTNVYISLCRHADNNSQQCFPSMEQIGEEIGIKRNAVSRAIKKLKEWGIIIVDEKYDSINKKRKNNIYTLTSKKMWKEKPCTLKIHGKPCTPNDKSHALQRCSNNTHINKTHTSEHLITNARDVKNNKKDMAWRPKESEDVESSIQIDEDYLEKEEKKTVKKTSSQKKVNTIFSLFIKYGFDVSMLGINVTQRKAAEKLYDTQEIEQIEKALQFYSKRKKDEFCPDVSTPYDLASKWEKLLVYKNKSE